MCITSLTQAKAGAAFYVCLLDWFSSAVIVVAERQFPYVAWNSFNHKFSPTAS